MCALNRIQVGNFNIKNSVTLEELQENETIIDSHMISLEKLFVDNGVINLNSKKLQLFLNGVQLTMREPDGVYKVYSDDKFIGIGVVKNSLLKRDIVVF